MWGRDKHPALKEHIDNNFTRETAMWSRAGREIERFYDRHKSPLAALSALEPPVPTLHLFAQPKDEGYLEAQKAFAAEHPWFSVQRIEEAETHFPALETPEAVARNIDAFVRR